MRDKAARQIQISLQDTSRSRLDRLIFRWSQNGSQIEKPLKTVLAGFFILIIIGLTVQATTAELRAIMSSQDKVVRAIRNLISTHKAIGTQRLTGLTSVLGDDRHLAQAVIDRDKERITRISDQVFAHHGQGSDIAEFTIYGANRLPLYRYIAPGSGPAADADFELDLAAALSRTTDSLEIRPDKTLIVTVLTPWMFDGRLLGYMKLAIDVDGQLRLSAAAADAELVKLGTGVTSHDALGRSADKEPSGVDYAAEGRRIASAATIDAMSADLSGLRSLLPLHLDNGRILVSQELPVKVRASSGDARLFLVRDITANAPAFVKGILYSLSVSTLSAALALLVFKSFLVRLQAAIKATRTGLERSVRANTRKLKRSQARLLEAQKIAAIGNWELNNATKGITGSGEFFRIMGIPPDTPATSVKAHLSTRIPKPEVEAVETLISHAIETCGEFDLEHSILRADGSTAYVHVRGRAVAGEDGTAAHIVGTVHDITSRAKAERQNTLMATILETSLNEIYILNSDDFGIEYANACALRNLGYRKEEATALKLWDINDTFTAQSVPERLAPLTGGASQSLSIEAYHQRKDGSRYPVDLRMHMLDDHDRRLFIAIANDVSERVQRENETRDAKERAERLAYFDPLTKLPNRAGCLKDAIQLFELAGIPAFLVHVDMDNFKTVNDTLGHLAGDYCLAETGRRLKEVCCGLAIPYRWGGDEFVILASSSNADPNELCERARRIMRMPMNFNGHSFWPTVSMGIALCPQHGSDFEDLLVNADLALYRSKNTGKDRITFYSPEMLTLNTTEAQLERELQMAVKRDEFFLEFQPQINMRSHRVTGMEALIRWQHPERGLVPPGDFLPVAEKCGLAQVIGDLVFDKAFAAAKSWIDQGFEFGRISVNISQAHLASAVLVDQFKSAMQRHGLTPDRIATEVLESVFFDDHQSCHVSTLSELHQMGVHVELDDFGTGYASLSHVVELPISGLKIDRSFTRQLLDDPKKEIVVNQLVHLARALDLAVVCEGVETDAQYDRLRMMGDFSLQGFLLARPMPFELATAWMQETAEELYFVF